MVKWYASAHDRKKSIHKYYPNYLQPAMKHAPLIYITAGPLIWKTEMQEMLTAEIVLHQPQ